MEKSYKETFESIREAAFRPAKDDSVKADKGSQVTIKNILVSVDKLEKRMNTIKGVRTKDYNEIKKELSDIRKEVVKLGK